MVDDLGPGDSILKVVIVPYRAIELASLTGS